MKRVFIILVVSALMLGCAQQSTVYGSGATFPEPQINKWITDYPDKEISIEYSGKGSGGGQNDFKEGLVDFACTDPPVKESKTLSDISQEVSLYHCKLPEILFEAEKPLNKMFDIVRRGYKNVKGLREKITELDNQVDNIYVEAMEEIERDCDVNAVLTARHIERIGDLLTKIVARQIFVEEGRRVWII